MKRMGSNKKIAALLNFVFWGFGYLYLGKRKAFGAGMFIVEILEHAPILFLGLGNFWAMPLILYPISHTLISILLAYDVYKE